MKLKRIFALPLFILGIPALLTSCKPDEDNYKRRSDGLIDFSDVGLKEECYPVLDKVDQDLNGQITVALVFEGRDPGYQAVAKEFQRIHNQKVKVNINNGYTSETYPDKVKQELNAASTTWDIIQGNLTGGLASTKCFNFNGQIDKPNALCSSNSNGCSITNDNS